MRESWTMHSLPRSMLVVRSSFPEGSTAMTSSWDSPMPPNPWLYSTAQHSQRGKTDSCPASLSQIHLAALTSRGHGGHGAGKEGCREPVISPPVSGSILGWAENAPACSNLFTPFDSRLSASTRNAGPPSQSARTSPAKEMMLPTTREG